MTGSARRGGGFPTTRYSVVRASAAPDPEVRRAALEVLTRAYWMPVYKYLRLRWHKVPEDAEDLTQEFFSRALEKGTFHRYDPSKARFRTFVRVCLDRFVGNVQRTATRMKRGGSAHILSLDAERAEGELQRALPPSIPDPERYFHREWLRSFLALAVEELRNRCEAGGKASDFLLFQRLDLAEDGAAKPSYAELADGLGMTSTQVNNHLAATRRKFRTIVLTRLREFCGSEEEFRAEARELGIETT